MAQNHTPEIVIAGGGIAALELVLALRDLAGDRIHMTLVAPEPELTLRPMLVAEPLGHLEPQRHSLALIAADVGFHLVPASVTAVDPDRGVVVLRGGGTLDYATLVLAAGARRLPAFDDVIHIGDADGVRDLQALREAITRGDVKRVAFVAPFLTGWLLPLYEAALLTARLGAETFVVTAEERPLALFGGSASAAVERELRAAGVAFYGDRRAAIVDGAVVMPDVTIPVDRVVSLPMLRGPRIEGVPATGLYGLIPVDDYGRVKGLADVYAIGDATDFPIKQGGLACQQAGAAATHIAARHGAPVRPEPFKPALGATLLTGDGAPILLGRKGEGAPGKVPGRYLGPYLAATAAAPA